MAYFAEAAKKRKKNSQTCHRKCLTVSEGNIVRQGCVCYLCISLSGLPVDGSMGSHGRGMWVCYRHSGPCNHRLESYREQVYRGPHPHQHNMPPPDRTNYTASTPTLQPPPKNKLTLPLNQTVAAAYTLSAMVLLLRETYKGKQLPDYSFGPICFHLPALLYHTI